jgi:hypothetical protein
MRDEHLASLPPQLASCAHLTFCENYYTVA